MKKDFPLIAVFVVVLIALIWGGTYVFLLFNPEKTQKNEEVQGVSTVQRSPTISPTTSSESSASPTPTFEPTSIIATSAPEITSTPQITKTSTNTFKLQINKTYTFSKNSVEKKIIGKTESNAEVRVLNSEKKELQSITADEDGDFDFDVEETAIGTYKYYFRGFIDKKSSDLVIVEIIIN